MKQEWETREQHPFQRICNPLEPFGGFVIHNIIAFSTGLQIPILIIHRIANPMEQRSKNCKSDGTGWNGETRLVLQRPNTQSYNNPSKPYNYPAR